MIDEEKQEQPELDDVDALKGAVCALYRSTSRRMLEVNLRYIWDYFIAHPSPELPDHLKKGEP